MRIKEIYYSSQFEKSFKKIPKHVKKEALIKEKLFRRDPFHSSLKTHRLKGKFRNYYSLSITYSYRVLFEFINENKVGFINIGTHSIYK